MTNIKESQYGDIFTLVGYPSRWDTGRPANMPVAKLVSSIADRGIKLPPAMKKAQVLLIYIYGQLLQATLATGFSVDTNASPLSTRRRHDGESPPN